ncbi:MAG: hypothetical protein AAFZ80_03695 [Cyanobacteria bacterium P01_A01_bin.105]
MLQRLPRAFYWTLWAACFGLVMGCARSLEPDASPAPNPDVGAAPAATAAPPPPPPGAFLAQLQPDVNAELLALGIPIAIPTYLPPGFDLAAYDTGNPPTGPYYGLVYRNAESQCFAIEGTSDGGSSPVLSGRRPLESPLFGSSYVLYVGQLSELDSPVKAAVPDLVSDWLAGDVALYRYAGAQLTMAEYDQPACADLPPEEAVKIIESLAYLTSDIYGDDWGAPTIDPGAPVEPVFSTP